MRVLAIAFIVAMGVASNATTSYTINTQPTEVVLKYHTIGHGEVIVSMSDEQTSNCIKRINVKIQGRNVRVKRELFKDLQSADYATILVGVRDNGTLEISFKASVVFNDQQDRTALVTLYYLGDSQFERSIVLDDTEKIILPPPATIQGELLASTCNNRTLLINTGTKEKPIPTTILLGESALILHKYGGQLTCSEMGPLGNIFIWTLLPYEQGSDKPIEAAVVVTSW